LLYLLLDVAMRGLWALVALAIVVPPVPGASSGVRLICAVSPLRSDLEGMFRVENTGYCPLSFTSTRGLDTAAFVSGGWVVIVELGALLLQ
jgi:hypothetical protein